MSELSKLIIFGQNDCSGSRLIQIVADCFGEEVKGLSDEAKILMKERLTKVSPRTINQSAALKVCQ